MSAGRAWGYGLMGLGATVGALFVVWFIVNAAGGNLRAGGVVLWLVLVAVTALPLLAGGYYLLRQSEAEGRASVQFEARRRVFEGDRLFREQAAADLRDLAGRLNGA